MAVETKYKKCHVVSFGRNVDINYKYRIIVDENNQMMELERQDKVKDLGVWFDERLTFKEHINEKIDKAYMMLGVIKRNFRHLTISTFVLLYKSMVRSHLDYCSSVWAPYMKGDIEALERVQKRATKLIPALQHLPYSDRLRACGLTTLNFRRIRGDIIETYKILSGKYDADVVPFMNNACTFRTRGNDMRLQKVRFKYDLRKYCFTNRVVNIWNSLPNWVVTADSTNIFKTRLDTFWHNQDIMYDFRAQLEGTGSRSEI